ncbi:MAG: hypothetical protein IKC11_01490 [Clostridia bacterium]|nr:hypothetical protein [Clostridia bacterium]
MANPRTIIKEKFTKPQEQLEVAIMKLLAFDGYQPVIYKGEKVFKKGDGVWSAEELIKIEFSGDEITISGWILVYGKEQELKGFVGCVPKKDCKKSIDKILTLVKG